MENNIKKYFNVLRNNEDLSYGGLRTLKIIEDEFDNMDRALAKQSNEMNELAEQREQMKRWNKSREAAEQKGMEQFNKYREQFHKPLVSGSSSPDDFWKQEYDEAVKEIGNLQDQLKDAESAIRDMESELRSRY